MHWSSAPGQPLNIASGSGEDKIWQRIQALSGYMRQGLSAIRGVRVLDKGPALAGLVTFHVQGSDPNYLVHQPLSRKINVVPSFRKFAVLDIDEKGVSWAVRASPPLLQYHGRDGLLPGSGWGTGAIGV